MDKQQQMVAECHERFGHPVADGPQVISMERAKTRARWMVNELEREFLEAIEREDILAAYGALLRGEYHLKGTAVEMGLDLEPGFNVVHRASMDKLGPGGRPVYDEAGNVQLPEGWVPPEDRLAPLLHKQIEDAEVFRLATEVAEQYRQGYEVTLPTMPPGRVVRVIQGVSVILRRLDPPAWQRWAREWDER